MKRDLNITIQREKEYSAKMSIEVVCGDEPYKYWTHTNSYTNFIDDLTPRIWGRGDVLGTANPIQASISSIFSASLKGAFRHYEAYESHSVIVKPITIIYNFAGNEVYIEKPYEINGIKMSLKEIGNKLSRMAISLVTLTNRKHSLDSLRHDMKKKIKGIMKTPEDILYCLENKVPYYFYTNDNGYRKEEVRLNLRQIGPSLYALEITDGKWCEIKEKDLTTYLGHYLHGQNIGSWKLLSPKKLYSKLNNGEEPLKSEMKVMIAFLSQNRTQDIVEKRAKELIDDMAIQYKDRILIVEGTPRTPYPSDTWTPMKMLVKGQKTDWLLVENASESMTNPQRVHTYGLLTSYNGESVAVEATWNGPICINTGGRNPSLGDQFAGRALLLMNDSIASSRVSTIGSYMTEQQDRIRISLDEKYMNEGDTYEYNEMQGMSIQ